MKKGNIYSINEGHASLWNEATTQYVQSKKTPKTGKPYGKLKPKRWFDFYF